MQKQNYLIFDIGASNGRVIVAQYTGEKFHMNQVYRFHNVPVYVSGKLYWDILRIYSDLKLGISLALKRYGNVKSLALSTWGVDFGFIDINGQLISNPTHYRDPERIKMFFKIYKDIISAKDLFKLVGGPISVTGSINQIYLLKLKKATEIKEAYKFLMISDIFNYFLTKEITNEFTIATTTTMFNIGAKKWEKILLNKLKLRDNIFSDIILPGDIIGNMCKDVAREFGIKSIPIIAVASHDTASAIVGIPNCINGKNWAFLSMGTWSSLGILSKDKIVTDLAFNEKFDNEGSAEGLHLFLKNMTGLWIIQECRNKWIKEFEREISWNEIVMLALKSTPFKCFIDTEDINFIEPKEDMTSTIIDYCKFKNQNLPNSIGEISRCVYESLVLRIKYYLKVLEKIINKKIEILYFVGGGTKNKLLCQWISNVSNIPILVCSAESASIGNLIFQLKALKEISTINEGKIIGRNSSSIDFYEPKETETWEDAYQKFLRLFINYSYK